MGALLTSCHVTMRKNFVALLLVCLMIVLAGCGPAAAPTTAPATPAPDQPTAEPTATTESSPTPQPGRVVLVAPPGVDAQPVQALLAELVASAGWEIEARADLPAGEVSEAVRVVVMLSPVPNLNELLAAAPQVQFVVYSPAELQPAPNLTVIRRRQEMQAFLAGFTSVLISPDYRAAGLLVSDGPHGSLLQEAYVNGGRYFCGVCAPGWPLGMYFPVAAALPAASDGPTWLAAAADMFDNKKVDLYFLAPEALKPEVIEYISGRTQFDRTVVAFGVQPPPDALREQWAATLVFDDRSALQQVWPQISAGQSAGAVDASLALEDINEDMLSPGRLRLIEELMEELSAGRVDPFTVANQ